MIFLVTLLSREMQNASPAGLGRSSRFRGTARPQSLERGGKDEWGRAERTECRRERGDGRKDLEGRD